MMLEITNGMSARELTQTLLVRHNLLIKDLSKKIKRGNKQFIRVAVKKREENLRLVCGLRKVFGELS